MPSVTTFALLILKFLALMHGDWSVSDREGKTADERRYEGENNGCKRLYNYISNSIGTIDKVNVFKYFFFRKGKQFP